MNREPRARGRELFRALLVLALAAGAAFSPLVVCPLRFATGFPCPGCGTTRALLKLASLDVRGALHLQPLAPAIALLLVATLPFAVRALGPIEHRTSAPAPLRYAWTMLIAGLLMVWGARLIGLYGLTIADV